MSRPLLYVTEVSPAKLESLLDDVQVKMRVLTQALTAPIDDSKKLATASGALAYHLGAGGQRIRAKLGLYASCMLGLNDSDAICIAACAELLHNASLIHDDLQDGDSIRRGRKTVWARYGKNLAICTGDLALSAAYGALSQLSTLDKLPAILLLVHQRTRLAIAGQCADLCELDPLEDPIDQYLSIAKSKSGALLGLPLELALLASDHGYCVTKAQSACEDFAVSYQIIDDLQDLSSDAERAQNRSSNDAAPVLNIVLLLQNLVGDADASCRAAEIASEHLARCEATALQLPLDSGLLLLHYCKLMRATLNDALTLLEPS